MSGNNNNQSAALIRHPQQPSASNGSHALIKRAPAPIPRTSSLSSPIMLLTGHTGDVNSVKFSPDGKLLASGSHDKSIHLWNVYGSCENVLSIKGGHSGPVLDVQWFRDSCRLVSASADHDVCAWDISTGQRLKRWRGHSSFVQCVAIAHNANGSNNNAELVASGSDNTLGEDSGHVKLWDLRQRYPVATIPHRWPATALAFNDTNELLFVGSIDNTITPYDMRFHDPRVTSAGHPSTLFPVLHGHTDTITCLRLSPDGTQLMSNAQDNTVRVWDVKPFSALPNRQVQVLEGAPHGFDRNLLRGCWSPDGSQIACGSGDRTVCVWEVDSAKMVYKLPGHKGTVNEVDWHPHEPILASGSIDKTIYLGEINPPGEVSYRLG